MKKQLLYLFLLFIGINSMNAQQSKYYKIGTEVGAINFTDFATSPLEYSGPLINFYNGYLSQSSKRETNLALNIGFGNSSDLIKSKESRSNVYRLNFDYSKLFAITRTESLNIKLGARFDVLGILRTNPALMNNTVGLDVSPSLMATAKISKNLGSADKKRLIGFRANAGVLNSQLRKNYIYTTHTSVLNGADYDDISYNLFKGIRLNTELDYTHQLSNKNAINIAYLWDAYKTTGVKQNFQVASHTVRFTLLFNTNNK